MPRVKFYPYPPSRFEARTDRHDVQVGHQGAAPDGDCEGHNSGGFANKQRPPVAGADPIPHNEYQAAMEALPHEEPVLSTEERLPLREALEEGLAELNERERYVIERLYHEQLSLRDAGAHLSLSKTQVARVRDQALEKLKNKMTNDRRVEVYRKQNAAALHKRGTVGDDGLTAKQRKRIRKKAHREAAAPEELASASSENEKREEQADA